MKTTLLKILTPALVLVMSACSQSDKWSVKGTIDGAENAKIKIERAENGVWLTLDTLSTDSKGQFKYSHLPVGYPDVYRLAYDGKYIYFPIDSVESVTIKANADNFAADYTISGSVLADNMMSIDGMVNDRVKEIGPDATVNDTVLKRQLNELIVANPSSITAYYILLKQIDGKFLYNPTLAADNRIIGAIANAYLETRPNDPRTGFLKNIYLRNRPNRSQGVDSFEVTELDFYDIDLMDQNGKPHKLSDAVKNNKAVLLCFTAYAAQESPAFNILLNESYKKYKNSGLEIYQVSLDDDEYLWGQTAANLPWITVYNPPVSKSQDVVRLYNVQGLPTSFLFVDGQLVERVEDHTKLQSRLANIM